ncbi:MAG: hypothetical protein D6790_09435 [Caldilineae bacterium]|nr:MAG: hypothetical protein D6790_09435 [Caldilineae bacterium]
MLLVLLVAAFAWRLVGLTAQSLWRDEVDVIWLAIRPLRETISMFISPAQNGPLYFLLMRPWLQNAGTTEFALRYSSVLFGVLAIPLLWQVARLLAPGDGRPGLGDTPTLAALLLAVHPYHLWYSQEGKMYSLVVVLTLLSTWSWLKAMQRGGPWRWLTYLLVTSISIYTHLMTALILPVHFVWFLLVHPLNRRRWLGYGLTASGFVLPYIPLIWWQWHYLTTLDYQTGYSFTPFVDVVRVLLLDHTGLALAGLDLVWTVPVLFLALAGLLVGPGEFTEPAPEDGLAALRGVRRVTMLAVWLLLPVLLIHGVSLIKPIFVDRYVIWIGPAFLILVALGLRVLAHSGGRAAYLLGVLLTVFLIGLWLRNGWVQTHTPNKTQLREAVHYIAERRTPEQVLILQIPHAHYAYRYYTSDFGEDPFEDSDARLEPWAEGLWTHNALSTAEAMAQVEQDMARITAGHPEAWVLLTEASSWDPRGLMLRWLDEHATLEEQRAFHGVEVRRYRLERR